MSNTRLRGNLTPSGRLHGSIRAGISYGTFDYEELHNKPKINNQTLEGNKTASQLGLVAPSDLAPVATSGNYNDLENKPTIPAAQVNSDWNASSGKAQILNKPSIPTKVSELDNDSGFVPSSSLAPVATSGDYDDLLNKPSIPAAQVNADWDATEGVAQILNKPNIPAKVSDLQNDSDYVPADDLAEVAFSGDYDDLDNKPSVAPNATELPISDTDPTNTKSYIDTGLAGKQSKILHTQVSGTTDGTGDILCTDLPLANYQILSAYKNRSISGEGAIGYCILGGNNNISPYIHVIKSDNTSLANTAVTIEVFYIEI